MALRYWQIKLPGPILEIQRKVRHFPELGGSTVVNSLNARLKEERLKNLTA